MLAVGCVTPRPAAKAQIKLAVNAAGRSPAQLHSVPHRRRLQQRTVRQAHATEMDAEVARCAGARNCCEILRLVQRWDAAIPNAKGPVPR